MAARTGCPRTRRRSSAARRGRRKRQPVLSRRAGPAPTAKRLIVRGVAIAGHHSTAGRIIATVDMATMPHPNRRSACGDRRSPGLLTSGADDEHPAEEPHRRHCRRELAVKPAEQRREGVHRRQREQHAQQRANGHHRRADPLQSAVHRRRVLAARWRERSRPSIDPPRADVDDAVSARRWCSSWRRRRTRRCRGNSRNRTSRRCWARRRRRPGHEQRDDPREREDEAVPQAEQEARRMRRDHGGRWVAVQAESASGRRKEERPSPCPLPPAGAGSMCGPIPPAGEGR